MSRKPFSLPAEIARQIAAAGTRYIFGLPGGGNSLDIIGAAKEADIEFILAHTETSAALMAATYADLSANLGVSIATRGPGAASSVNGLAHALLDRVPLLAITECVPRTDPGNVAHQRLAQDRLFRNVAKSSFRLTATNGRRLLEFAISLAHKRPAGPVHIDYAPFDGGRLPRLVHSDMPSVQSQQPLKVVNRLVMASRRPLIILGLGARHVAPVLRECLATKTAVVLPTYRAKGVIPDTWTSIAGVFTGAKTDLRLLNKADLVITIGFDSVEALPDARSTQTTVIALAEWVGDSYFEPKAEIIGPLRDSIPALMSQLTGDWKASQGLTERTKIVERLEIPARGLTPQQVVLGCQAGVPLGTPVTIDAGAHMLAAMFLWDATDLGEVTISSGLSTMGFALPAAIAASLVHPDRHVLCLTGDGGLGMVLAELETLVRLRSKVIVVVFNDAALSLIRLKQTGETRDGLNPTQYSPVDYAMIGRGFGVRTYVAEDEATLATAVRSAVDDEGPSLIDARIDASVYPQLFQVMRGE